MTASNSKLTFDSPNKCLADFLHKVKTIKGFNDFQNGQRALFCEQCHRYKYPDKRCNLFSAEEPKDDAPHQEDAPPIKSVAAKTEAPKWNSCRVVSGLLRESRRRLSENEPLDAAAKRNIEDVLNDAAELIDDLLMALETRLIADQSHREKMAEIMEELQEDELIHDYLDPHCPECLTHAPVDQAQCRECGLSFAEVDELEGEIARGRHRREKLRNAGREVDDAQP